MAEITVQDALQLGLNLHRSGRIAEAESVYRQVLAHQPDNPDAQHLLGAIKLETGDLAEAERLVRLAIAHVPAAANYQNTHARILLASGRIDQAIEISRHVLEIEPNNLDAFQGLSFALRAQGRLDEACDALRQALAIDPGNAVLHGELGILLKSRGLIDQAAAEYQAAIESDPRCVPAYNNLGNILRDRGELERAHECFRTAVTLDPGNADAHCNLANVLRDLGRSDAAIAEYHEALRLKPNLAVAWYNLGNAFRSHARLAEAAQAYQRAVQLDPESRPARINLGNALMELGRLDDAIDVYRALIEDKPDDGDAHYNLANALVSQGLLPESRTHFRRAIELLPDAAVAHSNLIYSLYFDPDSDGQSLRDEHARWWQRHGQPLAQSIKPHTNNRDPHRRLRIGYVSPDFMRQAECFFVVPLLEAHDHERFEIHCYASVAKPDDVTDRIRAAADRWHDVLELSDADLAERIRADEIDVLVDLTMHLGANRLLTFARKPAPVQCAWLAYPGSTGLPTIGYRITDALIEPPDRDDSWSVEKPIRLPGCWCCYDLVIEHPPVAPLPAAKSGRITFGSLNAFKKHNDRVLKLWAAVLRGVSESRLIMLAPEGSARRRVQSLFQTEGIDPGRIEFREITRRMQYLQQYDEIDIALDPFPYNGITTTCDALCMGVPVVTFPGDAIPAARVGLSLLCAAGLSELVAADANDFVHRAIGLASDLPRLAHYRETLRDRVSKSRLMDGAAFTREMEAAYRQMWQEWTGAGQS